MIDIAALTIAPSRLWRGAIVPDVPIAFVDCSGREGADVPPDIVLPPIPVIALGEGTHRLARSLDAVIEPPFTPAALAERVHAQPQAAAITVQLLRLMSCLSPEDALTAESLAYATLQGSAEHRRWLAARPAPAPRAPGQIALARDRERLTITLASPVRGNPIDRTMRDQLYEALALAALDDSIAAVSLRARGKAFSLGAELGEFGTTTDPATAHAIRARTLPARQAAACAHKLDAHAAGACIGAGLELAAWARRFTATPNAWFQLPELAMGVLPGAGGCVSLTRRIGRQRTALLILSGRRLSARQALDWGLIDAIVDDPT